MSMNSHGGNAALAGAREQEWQFAAHELQATRRWLALQPQEISVRHFTVQPTLELRDTYYDSKDWMIYRAGYALRLRSALEVGVPDSTTCEITLKSLKRGHQAFAQRTEFSERVDSADMDAILARSDGVGERIRELVGPRALAPLFHAHTRRERRRLLEADSDLPLAEVDLDETSIETPTATGVRHLNRVEIECMHAEPAALAPWVSELRDAAQLHSIEESKFRAGLGAAGLDPAAAVDLGSLAITAQQPFALTQLALLRRAFRMVLEKEPLVRWGSADAVHEMRVAARHLDVLLRVFRGFGPAWALRSRGTLRKLMKALGAVRDCDVQLAYLDAARAGLSPADRPATLPMREHIEGARTLARARLLRTLDSQRTQQWARDWHEQLRAATPPAADPAQTPSASCTAVVAAELVREQAKQLRKRGDRLRNSAAPEAYHETRIRAKRLRYTLDAFASLFGAPAQEFVRALGKLQDVLGALHDATVRAEQFQAHISSGAQLPPATIFLIGRLVERDSRALDECRHKFTKAYRRIKRRRWRELSAAMRARIGTITEPRAA